VLKGEGQAALGEEKTGGVEALRKQREAGGMRSALNRNTEAIEAKRAQDAEKSARDEVFKRRQDVFDKRFDGKGPEAYMPETMKGVREPRKGAAATTFITWYVNDVVRSLMATQDPRLQAAALDSLTKAEGTMNAADYRRVREGIVKSLPGAAAFLDDPAARSEQIQKYVNSIMNK
jgi:hypothetical protein